MKAAADCAIFENLWPPKITHDMQLHISCNILGLSAAEVAEFLAVSLASGQQTKQYFEVIKYLLCLC